jgi:succinate-semialdehyde dehydrogenase / glutarate-semialdehyde dehydrogenase
MTYQSVNPFNGEIGQKYATATDAEVESALQAADMCFKMWRYATFQDRAVIAAKAAEILRQRVDEFASLVTLEMGKLIEESRGEVLLSADIIDYYGKNAESFLEPKTLKMLSGDAWVESTPIGVLLGIQPWNFPYYQLARFTAPNLMAGNVVMIKHAAIIPQCALAFEKLWLEAGAPKGAYTNLFVTHEQVNRLIDNPKIRGVAVTGSVEAGQTVAERAGKNMKKSTMELGGSDAFIVMDDADIDKTVKWAMWAKMNNNGQCCIAAKRFILIDSIADEFMKKFSAAMAALKPGDPMDASTTIGPMSTETALLKLLGQVEAAVDAGATLEMGGKRIARPGAFMEPTILSNIAPTNFAYYDEFFGPVALIFRVKDEAEAIALANDSEFGLGGSVFTKDISRGKRIARGIDTGMVFINHPTWTAPELPFGGVKNSGYGRELSSLGIEEFMNKKLVRVALIDATA